VHRFAARTLTAVSLVALLGAITIPAHAKSARSEHRGGKKAVGEIVSYDEATSALVVERKDGEELSATVDPHAQVKLDARGYSKKDRGRGNPTEGSLQDLLPGTPVLRLRLEDGVVTKIRLRPLAPETPPMPEAEDHGDAPEGAEDADAADAPDDLDDDSEDPEDHTDPDGDDHGDEEDALPLLAVPLP
jgi:hypothetical protein